MGILTTSTLALALMAAPLTALGQEPAWPTKPIRAIVPFAPGAAADAIARVVADGLSKKLGQPVVIDNRPGAGGTLGSGVVAQAAPDGYTILIHSNSHTVSKFVFANLNFDPEKDLVGVTPLCSISLMFVTSPDKGYKTIGDLVKAAKAKPDTINYASAGVGSSTHLGAERLRIAGGFTATHVPMKSTSEAMTEVIGGRVDYFLAPLGLVGPFLQSGKIVGLATADFQRSSAFPAIPTTGESGLPNAEYPGWAGIFVPAKTPRYIIDRINAATAEVMRQPDVQKRLEGLYLDALTMPQSEFAAFLEKDFKLTAELVKAAGMRKSE